MKEGHIFTDQPIDLEYPNYIQSQLNNIGNVDKIIHHISSPGGSVYAGYKAYQILKQSKKPIKAIVEGEAQSMASFMAMAADEIIILDPSRFMIHNPQQEMRGDSSTLQAGAEELRRIEDEMAQVYANRTKKSVDEIKAMMKKETRMSAKEAVEFGFADSTTDKKIDKQVYETLKAVAIGQITMEEKDEVKGILGKLGDKLDALVASVTKTTAVTTSQPKALDLTTADGKVLNVESENGDLVGKPVKIDGQPAEGSYKLADGRELVCAGGLVTEVKEAMTAEQKTIQDLQARLQAETAKQAALAAEAAKATEQLKTTATAMGEIKTEFEQLKKKTVGDDTPPATPEYAYPIAYGKTTDTQLAIKASRTFMFENMPWIEMEPKFRKKYPGGRFPDGTKFSDYRAGGPEAVSILETNFSYTWQGELTLDLFFRPSLSSPALNQIFTVDVGSKDKKRYNLVPTLSKIVKPYTGCDQAVTGTSLDIVDKYIQLKSFRMKEKWCQDDFTNRLSGTFNHLAQAWLKDGNEGFDPAGTPIDRIIMEALKDALRRDVFRRVMLGDADSSSADWNQINGLITTLIDQSGASNYCVYRYGSALGTGTLAANTASAYFQGLWENSNILLKEHVIDSGKGYFLTTRSMWENYYATLVGVGAVTEQAYADYKGGIKNLEFRGIPIIPMGILDSFLADATSPLYSTTRHIAVLSSTDNHIMGVENTGDLGKIKSWFSDDDNVRYYSSQMTFGVLAPLHCDLTSISY